MNWNALLSLAAEACIDCHKGQFDRNRVAYFMHPVRVSERVRTIDEKIVALLHDCKEKNAKKYIKHWRSLFPDEIQYAVEQLTHNEGKETYPDYILRICLSRDPMIITVKMADMEDNTDIRRMDDQAAKRFELYFNSYQNLKYALRECQAPSSDLPEMRNS